MKKKMRRTYFEGQEKKDGGEKEEILLKNVRPKVKEVEFKERLSKENQVRG